MKNKGGFEAKSRKKQPPRADGHVHGIPFSPNHQNAVNPFEFECVRKFTADNSDHFGVPKIAS